MQSSKITCIWILKWLEAIIQSMPKEAEVQLEWNFYYALNLQGGMMSGIRKLFYEHSSITTKIVISSRALLHSIFVRFMTWYIVHKKTTNLISETAKLSIFQN